MRVMAAPRECSTELQQPAVRMATEARKDPDSARGAIKRVADQLRLIWKHCGLTEARVGTAIAAGVMPSPRGGGTELM